jgi:hypothetical protein
VDSIRIPLFVVNTRLGWVLGSGRRIGRFPAYIDNIGGPFSLPELINGEDALFRNISCAAAAANYHKCWSSQKASV